MLASSGSALKVYRPFEIQRDTSVSRKLSIDSLENVQLLHRIALMKELPHEPNKWEGMKETVMKDN